MKSPILKIETLWILILTPLFLTSPAWPNSSPVTVYLQTAHSPNLKSDSSGNLYISLTADVYQVNEATPAPWSNFQGMPQVTLPAIMGSGTVQVPLFLTTNSSNSSGNYTGNSMNLTIPGTTTKPQTAGQIALLKNCYKTLLLSRLVTNLYPFLTVAPSSGSSWTYFNNGPNFTLVNCGTFVAPVSGTTITPD